MKNFVFPLLYIFLFSIPIWFFFYKEEYVFSYIEVFQDYISLMILYSLFYCLLALKLLYKVEHVIKHYYSNNDIVNVGWIKRILLGIIVVICIDVLFTIIELIMGELAFDVLYFTVTGVIFVITHLGYYGITQSRVLLPVFLLKNNTPEQNEDSVIISPDKKEKEQSQYDESEMKGLVVLLNDVMNHQKPYLDPDVSLSSLADVLNIKEKMLSSLLNKYIDKSFYTYINEYRVNEVKEKLSDPANHHLKMMTIAYDCGFNSKTSFNRIFKNTVGISPSQFKINIIER
ncbi:helix-turn-helix transcriptional regulator [Aquimarina sp. 2201CG1-2-11]|uniref:helix-turn-helix domain-containing protein n=1 Tax=Aquimarina discodermiae TaxID=3231043 RepID=UPI0034617FF9